VVRQGIDRPATERRSRPPARRSSPRPVRERSRLNARQRAGTRAGVTRRKALRRRWVALLTLLTVACVVYLLFFTSFLGVGSVEVTGAATVPADQIRTAAAVPPQQPMLLVDTGEIAGRVDKLAGVASVDVSRSWPSTIVIAVTERIPIGFFTDSSGVHLVDTTGLDYKTVPAGPAGLPELDLAHIAPDDAVTRSVVAVLASLPQALKAEITNVRAQTPGGVEFTLKNGKIVRWGDAGEADRKAKVLAVLLTRKGHIYDVASPELPTVS
jgi:cell division protein FtsQ